MSSIITLTEGSPWGFKMIGGKDFHLPLTIGKVLPGGKAAKHGVTEGFVIEQINGEDATNMSHHEARNRIKAAGFRLTLFLSKPKRRSIPEESNISNAMKKVTSTRMADCKPKHTWSALSNGQQQWQIDQTVAQSPSLFERTRPMRDNSSNGNKATLVISREMKDLIIQDEDYPKENEKMKSSQVKALQPAAQSPPSSRKSSWHRNRTSNEISERNWATSNIEKFFQSSSAPRYGEPTFSKSLHDITAPLGEPAVLEIRLGPNLPVPTVHWYHENKPVRESVEKDVRILSNGPIHTLVLGELTSELIGCFTCTIINKHGSKSTRCNVTASTESNSRSIDLSNTASVRSTPPHSIPSRRVVASSSIDLYSKNNVEESYDARVNRVTPRNSFDDSEVMKVLLNDVPRRHHRKTPSMKHLEETLLPESDSL